MGDVKRYIPMHNDSLSTMKEIIVVKGFNDTQGYVRYEDYARAEQRVEELERLAESRKNRIEDDCVGVNGLLQENAALQREIAAFRAPVTDEELMIFCNLKQHGYHICDPDDITKLIAARASAQVEKGNGNG